MNFCKRCLLFVGVAKAVIRWKPHQETTPLKLDLSVEISETEILYSEGYRQGKIYSNSEVLNEQLIKKTSKISHRTVNL